MGRCMSYGYGNVNGIVEWCRRSEVSHAKAYTYRSSTSTKAGIVSIQQRTAIVFGTAESKNREREGVEAV